MCEPRKLAPRCDLREGGATGRSPSATSEAAPSAAAVATAGALPMSASTASWHRLMNLSAQTGSSPPFRIHQTPDATKANETAATGRSQSPSTACGQTAERRAQWREPGALRAHRGEA